MAGGWTRQRGATARTPAIGINRRGSKDSQLS